MDPCFGEVWLRAGTPSAPKGAIGFIGPSEIDTKTRWNNTNIAGIYQGILFENVQTLSAAMLRGKLELFREFPNNVDVMEPDGDRSVSFYFHCYNLLGDPGLTFFVNDVRDLSAAIPTGVALGTPTITLTVTEDSAPLAGAWGTVTRADTLISRAVSDEAGQITLALPGDQAGNVQVTLTKPRHATVQSVVALQTAASSVGARATVLCDDGRHGSSGNGDGQLNPGEITAVGVVLRNYGTAAYGGGSLGLEAEFPLAILTGQSVVPILAPQAQADTLWFLLQVAATAEDGAFGRFEWRIAPGDFAWTISAEIFAPRLTVAALYTDGAEGNPTPGTQAAAAIWLQNQGRATHPAFTATLRSRDARLIVFDSTASFGAIAPGATAMPNDEFGLAVGAFYPGDWATTEILTASPARSEPVSFALPIGNPAETDPTHPDGYGYRAFETADTGYTEAPPYAWVEIDPALGGAGTILSLPDRDNGQDTTITIPLPFGFRFYGNAYSQISVCSNGFLAFGQTTESFFRNYSLPAIASPDQMVCAFWDDLVVPTGSHICSYYDETGGRIIIEWSGLRNQYGLGQEETFQIVLFDTACWATRTGDGEILVQYKSIANVDSWDNNATIGIQDRDEGYALQISYAGSNEPGISALRSQQSILFTTGRPQSLAYLNYSGNVVDDDNEGASQGNGDGIAQNGETIELAFRIHNSGGTASPLIPAVVRSLDPSGVLPDSTTVIPPMAPGETVLSDPLALQIAGNTPNGRTLNFLVRLSGAATPCVLLPVISVSSPVLSVLPPLFDDDAIPPSIGNGNGELNSGETIELTAFAVNYGGNTAPEVTGTLQALDNRSTILQTATSFGDIAPDATENGQTPLVFRVNSGVGAGQSVSFRISIRDTNGFQASETQTFTVVRPVLTATGLRVDDAAPGGDGDGRLTLGETGTLFPRLHNEGGGSATGVVVRLVSQDPLVAVLDSVLPLGTIPPGATQEPAQGFRVAVSEEGAEPRGVGLNVAFTGDDGIAGSGEVFLILGDVQFFDDFETDMNYWSVFGSTHLWTRTSWEYHSPYHAFYCGGSGSHIYPPNADAYLRSPAFRFSGQGTLLFHTRFEIAAGDVAKVQFQTGISTYHLLTEFSGSSSGWEEQSCSLAGLPASEEAYVRFWFHSDWNDQAEGWHVDDVIVLEEDLPVDEPNLPGSLPTETGLEAAYPNPFNDRAMIRYRIAETGRVRLTLFDVQGRKVATLLDGDKTPGTYELSWRPLSIASGIYLIQLETDGRRWVGKIVHLK
ncbi:MAG: T9SS type A sorting domain-containing protein [bacterium]|nr:T9SS type A sorting domain-containing protein [bacterium]